MVRRGLSALIIMVFSLPLLADFTATVDRTTMYSDETLMLTLRADYPAAGNPLDLTALGTLFEIEQQSQSTQSRYTPNGVEERVRQWQFRLRPKRSGVLAVPNFKLGDERTDPIMVTVRDASDRLDDLPDDAVELSATLSDTEFYVGQPVTLTVDLHYRVRLQGNFERLSLDGFESELVQENNSIQNDGGSQYRRYRLVYRLTAEHSGPLRIPEIRFSGRYQSGQFDATRQLTRRHPGFDIEVKPIPDEFPDDAHWLPADSLTISDNFPEFLNLTANEHLDWAITTEVVGLSATRLPDPLAELNGEHFRLYRNAPEFDDDSTPSVRRDLNALVFVSAGSQQLPAIRLPWWNLRTDQLEYAELPARTVQVGPDTNSGFTPAEPAGTPAGPAAAESQPTALFWPWFSATLGLGWLATVLVWWASSRRSVPSFGTAGTRPEPATPPAELTSLARDGDRARFREALAAWVIRDRGGSLATLAPALPPAERAVLERLDASLFSADPPAPPTTEQLLSLLAALERGPARVGRSLSDPTRLYPR